MLKPHKKEAGKNYWKSLEYDPEGCPFALKYDPNESKRKRPRDEEPGGARPGNTTTPVTLAQVEELLKKYHSSLVEDVANRVVQLILEKSTDDGDTLGEQPYVFDVSERGHGNQEDDPHLTETLQTDAPHDTPASPPKDAADARATVYTRKKKAATSVQKSAAAGSGAEKIAEAAPGSEPTGGAAISEPMMSEAAGPGEDAAASEAAVSDAAVSEAAKSGEAAAGSEAAKSGASPNAAAEESEVDPKDGATTGLNEDEETVTPGGQV